MKKLIALFLAAVLCFSLGACGGNEPQNDTNGTQQETEQGVQTDNSTNEQTAAIVVHIAINPELKIYVDDKGNVFGVECLNDDAKAVNNKVSVIGKNCKDAIVLILNEMLVQGFLENNAKMEVTVLFAEEMADQTHVWMETVENGVMEVLAENNISTELVFDNRIIESQTQEGGGTNEQASSVNTENDDSETLPVETDANGNTIHREESGTISVVDKDGKVLQITDPDGIIVNFNYDGTGNLLSEEIIEPNGVITVRMYDSNGKFTTEEITDPDGNVVIRKYDEAGKVVSEEKIGITVSYTYHSNGSIASEIELHDSTGDRYERYYYENGTMSREYNLFADSTYSDTYYDESGKPTRVKWDWGDGAEDRTYNPDGTSYAYSYAPNGDVFYYEFDANGKQLLETHKQIN